MHTRVSTASTVAGAVAVVVALLIGTLETGVDARPMHAAIVSKYHRYLEEKDQIQTELDEWLAVYGQHGPKNGIIPVTESRSSEEENEDQRQRFFLSKEQINEARAANPLAEFGTQNPFTLMTMDEFQQFLQNSHVSAAYNKTHSGPKSKTQGKHDSVTTWASKLEDVDGTSRPHDRTEQVTRRRPTESSSTGVLRAGMSTFRRLREAETSQLSIQLGGLSLDGGHGFADSTSDVDSEKHTEQTDVSSSSAEGSGTGTGNPNGGWNFGAVSIGDGGAQVAQVAPVSGSTASSTSWWGAHSWGATSWWGTGASSDSNAGTNTGSWTFKSNAKDSNADSWTFSSTLLSGSNAQGNLAVNPQWTVDPNSQQTPAPDPAWTPAPESEWTPTTESQESSSSESLEIESEGKPAQESQWTPAPESLEIAAQESQWTPAPESLEIAAQESQEAPASNSQPTAPSASSSHKQAESPTSDSELSAAPKPTYNAPTRAPAPSSPSAPRATDRAWTSDPARASTPAPAVAPLVAPSSQTKQTDVSSSSSASKSNSRSDSSPISDSDAVDWSTSPCVHRPSMQGQCGSCWAFTSISALEAAQCIHNGDKNASTYSKQQLVSCDTRNFGCNGGAPVYALEYLRDNGVCTESSYAYTSTEGGQPAACSKTCSPLKSGIKEVKTIEAGDESALLRAVKQQPVIASVTSNNPAWKQYIKGVITSCPPAPNVDHATLVVAYDDTTIKIKNSWGTDWGEDGYVRLSRKSASNMGTCDVLKDMSYPEM